MKKSMYLEKAKFGTIVLANLLLEKYGITTAESLILGKLDYNFPRNENGIVDGVELDEIEFALFESIYGQQMAISMFGASEVKKSGATDLEMLKGIFKKYSPEKFQQIKCFNQPHTS